MAIEVDPTGQAWADDPAEGEAIRKEAIRYLISAGAAAHQRFAIDKAVELHHGRRSPGDARIATGRRRSRLSDRTTSRGCAGPRRSMPTGEPSTPPSEQACRTASGLASTSARRGFSRFDGAHSRFGPTPATSTPSSRPASALADDAETTVLAPGLQGRGRAPLAKHRSRRSAVDRRAIARNDGGPRGRARPRPPGPVGDRGPTQGTARVQGRPLRGRTRDDASDHPGSRAYRSALPARPHVGVCRPIADRPGGRLCGGPVHARRSLELGRRPEPARAYARDVHDRLVPLPSR